MASEEDHSISPTEQNVRSEPKQDATEPAEPRPYRSKKQRPCDHCRKRRVGCFIEPGQVNCTLCRHRSTSCTFLSAPPVKKRRSRVADEESSSHGSNVGRVVAWPGASHPVPRRRQNSIDVADDDTQLWSTLIPGHTFLYTGSSSDQDVYLLRHLPFRGKSAFGNSNWTVWKALAREFAPAYFTSYPNELLDAREGIYDLEHVKDLVKPNHTRLLSIYYAYFHPTLPILEGLHELEALISSHRIPESLLAAVYCAALDFWDGPDASVKYELRKLVFERVAYEARTPSLRTVQATVIYLQLAPLLVREPNHPGYWPLTAKLVAISQEIGLHAEPQEWRLLLSERKMRRILWWTVFMQDKWLAHWYGRPSHIHESQFHMKPLARTDLCDDHTKLDGQQSAAITAFISLTDLSVVLASVLDNFYSVKSSCDTLSAEQALVRASNCQAQLTAWHSEYGEIWKQPGSIINNYVVIFAYYGIAVSIQRALFTCVGGTSYYDIQRETTLFREIFGIFETLLQQNLIGLWLSYTRSNIAILGSFLITALLSSTDDEIYKTRQDLLETYSSYLEQLAQKFDFAKLPELRLNLLLERFSTDSDAAGLDDCS